MAGARILTRCNHIETYINPGQGCNLPAISRDQLIPCCKQKRFYSAPIAGKVPESKQKYVPTSGTYPKGFSVSGTHVGVKPSNTTFPDLALITSDRACSAAALFTKNVFQAAPVTISKQVLDDKKTKHARRSRIRSIIINSGCANAVTGKGGLEDARSMAASLDGLEPDPIPNSSLVMSTGASLIS